MSRSSTNCNSHQTSENIEALLSQRGRGGCLIFDFFDIKMVDFVHSAVGRIYLPFK